MGEHIRNILEQMPFWKHLTQDQKDRICNTSKIVKYHAGEIIYSPARECLGTVFIQKGIVRAYLLSDEGKEITFTGSGKTTPVSYPHPAHYPP